MGALRRGLEELGWIEGRNLQFEVRHAVGPAEHFPVLAAELVRADADVIVTQSAGLAEFALRASNLVPIVTIGGDLEGSGLVTSLRAPGGNVTGMQLLSPELMGKRLELLKELVPEIRKIAIIKPITPGSIITARYLQVIAETAQGLGFQTQEFAFHVAQEIAPAFASAVQAGSQAALVFWNPLSMAYRHEICAAAAQSRLPTIYEVRGFTASGGLISYGIGGFELVHRLATYVDKILKGAKPGELPIEQATKFVLVVNLKAAKGLGINVPPTLLARANEVIE